MAGLVFTFAVIVMPGIRKLPDRSFIRAFQVMDGIIQNNQPLFLLVWIGSALALIASVLIGWRSLNGPGRLLILAALAVSILGIHLPTVTINIPLNNNIQRLDVATADDDRISAVRRDFEARWNRWNNIRTILAALVTFLLATLLTIL